MPAARRRGSRARSRSTPGARRRRPRGSAPPRRRRRPAHAAGVGQSSSVPSPSSTTKISSSAEWRCGGAPSSPAGSLTQLRPRELGAGGARERAAELPPACSPSTSSRLTTRVGPRAELRQLRFAGRGLSLPRMRRRPGLDPASRRATRPRLAAGARPPSDRGYRTRARRAHRRPLAACAARADAMDDAVAGADLERRSVEQADARTAEDEEDLLLRGLPVERRRPLPGSIRIRFTPTVFVPAAAPRSVHSPAMWPASARPLSTSSQWAITCRLCPVPAPCRGARPPPPSSL